jgi:hypothetical protein
VLGKEILCLYLQIVRRNSTAEIDTERLGAGERVLLRRMHGRARNMERKNRSGTEGTVKMETYKHILKCRDWHGLDM